MGKSHPDRDRRIYYEYHGINEVKKPVPARVLAERFKLTRGRVYQIIAKEKASRERANPRFKHIGENTLEDAKRVAEMLLEVLGEA